MGKPKKELSRIHSRRIKKAKEKVKNYRDKKISYNQIGSLGRKMLLKGGKKK
jgi:hypothetical protein